MGQRRRGVKSVKERKKKKALWLYRVIKAEKGGGRKARQRGMGEGVTDDRLWHDMS